MATQTPTRETVPLYVQTTGKKKVSVKCVTSVDGKPCGKRSAEWFNIVPPQTWAIEHAKQTGHTEFERDECSEIRVAKDQKA
ncbi:MULTISPECIES: DUF7848 domain-containing protein [Streptomyces]|uniref:DUF7848 domain-containing protein n=1 Tax=Streptomyces TaxID=1883 RepID=UPI0004CDCB80|nr:MULTISPECIES: hypothetical protein [Streptomyces]KOT56180.1 hypothetical protein ADK43_23940 [Streptomyces rimosus subsp. rimosus]